ncbi:MAG TPA: hypothetical protein DD723_03415 [Candidatus Omnitrophica bacterium]|nr:MAG: hypothetical protein A2Z81_00860 [Omnitrophica WOR_2 bacterium GWA2_45_18]HBR14579.1 hypothetical protein [Candidatus Omnitrophota bacterium]
MNPITTYSFCENFLDRLTEDLVKEYADKGRDLSRLAIVFGGKRPALFLNRALARRLGKNFFPPKFLTIDAFVSYTLKKREYFKATMDLDNCYLLYQLASHTTPEILEGRRGFAQFLPWIREISGFIDQLDLENVPEASLRHIESNARIGYAVPPDINRLLNSIVTLRAAYHEALLSQKTYSRGLQYLRAAEVIEDVTFEEFDQILFCNFFYFNRSEEALIKSLYQRRQAALVFQGDRRKWPILERISKNFGCSIVEREGAPQVPEFDVKLYGAFDAHSQIGLAREILKNAGDLDKTVIVLPDSDLIVPLLSEIVQVAREFNISMGYPLKRSSLYSLMEFIFQAQLSRKEQRYYAKDYLKVLRHPFVKNLTLSSDAAVTRILVHKIEEILTGKEMTPISGSLFIELEDIESLDELYMLALETLDRMGIAVTRAELHRDLEMIHSLFWGAWEKIENFRDFAEILERFLDVLMAKSFLKNYPLNLNIATRMLEVKEELEGAAFHQEPFLKDDIFRIFESKMAHEIVAFSGSPLKGLQILGLFETRALNFENVIILDVNEGVLPKLRIYEPLIPREVMISLNLDRLELEEEIQRYQFMRLISSARKVHLIYQESKDKERSRFIEELIWEEEKKQKRIGVTDVTRASFSVKVESPQKEIRKTPEMIEALRKHTYSASSINMYLKDPVEFYVTYVLGIKENEDLLDEPEARHVGTFIHELLEHSLHPFLNKKPHYDSAFRQRVTQMFEQKFEETFAKSMTSDSFMLKSVMAERLNRFWDNEESSPERAVEQILFLEHRFEETIPLSCGPVRLGYVIDRVDKMKDGTIMIIDYKTGGIDQMPKAVDRVATMELSRESIRENVRSFQIPLYFHYLNERYHDHPINAALYNLRTLELHRFIDKKMNFSREQINAAFLRALDFIMTEILDPQVPFVSGEEI